MSSALRCWLLLHGIRGNPFRGLEGVGKKTISLNPYQSHMLCLDSDNYYSRPGTILRKGHCHCLLGGSKKAMKLDPSLRRWNFPCIALERMATISIVKIWFLGIAMCSFYHSSGVNLHSLQKSCGGFASFFKNINTCIPIRQCTPWSRD